MEVKVSTVKNIAIGSVLVLVSLLLVFFVLNNQKSSSGEGNSNDVVTTSGNKQIINLTAKAGYSPSLIEAKAGMETTLKVSTQNTFDCSSAFRIPSLGVSENLPINGVTEIPIAAQKPGAEINGTCSMGMYNFKIKFI